MSRIPYSYTLLKYVHDAVSGEMLNVGVVVYAPSSRYVQARIQHEYSRLSATFAGFYGDYYRKVARHIENRINNLSEKWISELAFDQMPSNARSVANMVLPDDDSSLQFSAVYSGLTDDPSVTLDQLYDRFVLRGQQRHVEEPRQKEEVWKTFRASLSGQNVLPNLKPVVLKGESFEYEFEHAYKNTKWHPLEAISMDAVSGETLKDRAVKWVGRATDLQSDPGMGKLYLLVGSPRRDTLKIAYDKALNLLHKMPVDHEIVMENEAEDFARDFASMIRSHEAEE